MRVFRHLLFLCPCLLALGAAGDYPPALEQRILYLTANHLDPKKVEDRIALIQKAAAAGYTSVIIYDMSKLFAPFWRSEAQQALLTENAKKIRAAVKAAGMKYIASTTPVGYWTCMLALDPNLAEGMPVEKQGFLVKAGRLVPDPADCPAVANGSFEAWEGGAPSGWVADRAGESVIQDGLVALEGKSSVLLGAPFGKDQQVRVYQKLSVKPFHYYHVSVAVRTENLKGRVQLVALGSGGTSLREKRPDMTPADQTSNLGGGWFTLESTFNTLENREIRIYLGAWNASEGKVWFDRFMIEPAGFVNLIRRDSLPVSLTSADGKTTYSEGKDFGPLKDPLLGFDLLGTPASFSEWHSAPDAPLPAGSALVEGQRLLASYHHATWGGQKPWQVNCCLAEPKIYELMKRQIAWLHATLQPDSYFLTHDEIRHVGWDASCQARHLGAGALLAENVKKCIEMIRAEDPGKDLYIWGDMFDPYQNANKRPESPYYLVRGADGFWGSWEGLDKDVIIINWNCTPKYESSLKFFAGRGNRQILAGFYDDNIYMPIGSWLQAAAKVPGCLGVMYTTWMNDYRKVGSWLEEAKAYPGAKAPPAPQP